MNLRELQYVVAVADHRHFGRAAQACHVAQPTLSGQIKKLEEYLGVVLFERAPRGARITSAGAAVVAQARVVVQEAERLRDLARAASDPFAGTLRLGVIPTLGPYYLPFLLPRLRAHYPKLRVVLNEDLTDRLLGRLSGGQLDAALLALPVHGEHLVEQALFFESFVAAFPADHPLAKPRPLRERDLYGAPLLLLEDGHCLRDQALAVCGSPRGGAEEVRATSLETLRQMVRAGIGCTLLPQLAAATQAEGLCLRRFANPPPGRLIGLVWRASYPRDAALRTLATLLGRERPAGVAAADGPLTRTKVARKPDAVAP
jgi:LysR family transcriptional regulator, hydrogen peroxide-inducible genes activator